MNKNPICKCGKSNEEFKIYLVNGLIIYRCHKCTSDIMLDSPSDIVKIVNY